MPVLPLHPLTHLHSSTSIHPPSTIHSFTGLSIHLTRLINRPYLFTPPCSLCLNALSVFLHLTLTHLPYQGFPGSSEVKASACNVGDPGSIPGLGRSPGEGNGNPLQYSCLENPMDGGAWWLQSTGSQGVGHD